MSSGLSMASVNRIKEFAAAHEYSLAVEILDSQDLEKSLNPQFLAVCAEVYENVGRLQEARQLYVKAHIMAPQSNRILFCMENYYLKRGFFGLAEKYLEQIRFNASSEQDTLQAGYILDKAKKVELSQLYDKLYPQYLDELDETWSFELYLLSLLLKKEETAELLSHDYPARFKTNHHVQDMGDIQNGTDPEEFFYIYADGEKADADEAEKALREEEAQQLIRDMRRMHPEQFVEETPDVPEILTDAGDDNAAVTETAEEEKSLEKGLKRFIKKKFKKKAKPGDEAEGQDAGTGEETSAGEADASAKAGDMAGSEEKTSSGEEEQSMAGPEKGEGEKTAEQPEGKAGEGTPEIADIVSVSFDDGFAPETDSVAELAEEENERELRTSFTFGKLAFVSRNAVRVAEERKESAGNESAADPEIEMESAADVLRRFEEETEKELRTAEAEYEAPAETEAEPVVEEPAVEEKPVVEEPEVEEEFEEEPEAEEDVEAEAETLVEEPEVEEKSVVVEAESEAKVEEPETEEEIEEEPEAEEDVEAEAETLVEEPEVEEKSVVVEAESEAKAEEPETEEETPVHEKPEVSDNFTDEDDFLPEDEYGYEDDFDEDEEENAVSASEKVIRNLKAVMMGTVPGGTGRSKVDEAKPLIEEENGESEEEETEEKTSGSEGAAEAEIEAADAEVEAEAEIEEAEAEAEEEPEYEAEAEAEIEAAEAEVEAEAVIEETEAEAEEEPENEAEAEEESEIEETEAEESLNEEAETEAEPEYEAEPESEPEAEAEIEKAEAEPSKTSVFTAPPQFDIPEEKSFRKLSSDLFIGTEDVPVHKKNGQTEELRERADKLSKSFDEEARKLKETEELLASLGIKL